MLCFLDFLAFLLDFLLHTFELLIETVLLLLSPGFDFGFFCFAFLLHFLDYFLLLLLDVPELFELLLLFFESMLLLLSLLLFFIVLLLLLLCFFMVVHFLLGELPVDFGRCLRPDATFLAGEQQQKGAIAAQHQPILVKHSGGFRDQLPVDEAV